MHIHLRPNVVEDFRARLEERTLARVTIMTDSQEMIDSQTTCCKEGADEYNNCYHTLHEVRSR